MAGRKMRKRYISNKGLCFVHGSVNGCTIDCPALCNHGCEYQYSENKELYQEMLDQTAITIEDARQEQGGGGHNAG